MGRIQLKEVTKSFGDVQVIPPLDLTIEDGEFAVVGSTEEGHRQLRVRHGDAAVIDEPLSELKDLWKNGLTPYY